MRLRPNRLTLVFVSLVLLFGTAASSALAEGVTWLDMTMKEALVEAEKTGKMIMLNVGADHCGACGDMDEQLWSKPDGEALADGTIPIYIDSTTPEGSALNNRYPITGLPVVIFIKPNGRELGRVVGYTSHSKFMAEAQPLSAGIDPLPALEAELEANPESVMLILPVMERYLYRFRDEEAKELLARILELDPDNRFHQSERALIKFAKHARIIWNDMEKCDEYWRMLLERFPTASSTSGAVNGTHRAAVSLRRLASWKEWICDIAKNQPENARLHYSLAMTAKRGGLRGPCFAEAARKARALGFGGAFLDTLAIELEGSGAPGK